MTGVGTGSTNASAFLTDEMHLLTVSAIPGDAGAFTSNSISFFIDGTATASSSQPVIHVPRVLNRSKSTVGRYVPGNGSPTVTSPGWFRGDVAEILVWFRELAPAERVLVEAYLESRWM
jgi:hypothetical protein